MEHPEVSKQLALMSTDDLGSIMRGHNLGEGTIGIEEFLTLSRKYTLSNRWILRRDPNFHTPYSAYNINSGDKYNISDTLFIILKVLENNCLTIEHVYSYLDKNGVQLQIAELIDFIHNLNEIGILTVSEKIISSRITKRPCTLIKFDVPVTSTPYEAEIHLTKACNLICRHCAYNAGRKMPNQLEVQIWFKIFDQLEDLRTHRVIVSGGEPLIYQGAKPLIEYLTSKRIRIDLLTNGTLIDKSIAVHLASPNFSTSVSLDGAHREIHDLLRGQGCFDKVIKGLKILSQAGAFFNIATTVHKKNIHEIEDIVEIGVGLGARSVNFMLLDPIGRAKYQKDLLLEPQDIVDISITIKSLIDMYGDSIYIGYLDPSIPNYKDLDITNRNSKIFCTAGTTRMAIRSDGIVFPCVYAFHDNRFAIGSTRLQSIEDIWLSDSWKLFRGSIELRHLYECRNCSLSEACTLKICRLRAYYSNGDFFGRPYGCNKPPAT